MDFALNFLKRVIEMDNVVHDVADRIKLQGKITIIIACLVKWITNHKYIWWLSFPLIFKLHFKKILVDKIKEWTNCLSNSILQTFILAKY